MSVILGKINLAIYGCLNFDLITEEVIITDERIQHIKDHHPSDYERYCDYLPAMIAAPDYMIQDVRPFTVMILKEFSSLDTHEHFRLALRFVTPGDREGFKNSVITFMKIREKEYQRLIRNKKVLYRRE